MASRLHFNKRISAAAFVFLLACVLAFPAPVQAQDLPSFISFIESVKNGDPAVLRGVYVPNVMALAVEQQPAGYASYVSSAEGTVTQFSIASEVGNVGLLAHNTHAGAIFPNIQQGSLIFLVYGDGRTETFMAQSVQRYQALEPYSPYSQFKDLETQITLTAEELFNKVYRGEYHLTLQTCIEKDGNPSWGRLFILAFPIQPPPLDEDPLTASIVARKRLD
ncbi:MAG: hypothetical protein LDL50_03675 [Chloroflexi bacterium]|nr:hypothetical protein [Chloroflexota bacterium]